MTPTRREPVPCSATKAGCGPASAPEGLVLSWTVATTCDARQPSERQKVRKGLIGCAQGGPSARVRLDTSRIETFAGNSRSHHVCPATNLRARPWIPLIPGGGSDVRHVRQVWRRIATSLSVAVFGVGFAAVAAPEALARPATAPAATAAAAPGCSATYSVQSSWSNASSTSRHQQRPTTERWGPEPARRSGSRAPTAPATRHRPR